MMAGARTDTVVASRKRSWQKKKMEGEGCPNLGGTDEHTLYEQNETGLNVAWDNFVVRVMIWLLLAPRRI
jgi:hypothetical protein